MKPVAMFQKRSTIYFMNIPEIYIYEGERNEDFLHLKRYPCEECAGVYERPVLNQPSNRSEATSREGDAPLRNSQRFQLHPPLIEEDFQEKQFPCNRRHGLTWWKKEKQPFGHIYYLLLNVLQGSFGQVKYVAGCLTHLKAFKSPTLRDKAVNRGPDQNHNKNG